MEICQQVGKKSLPFFAADAKGIPTRSASNKVINTLAKIMPELMGGSADLTTSNSTMIDDTLDFQPGQYEGRYIYLGCVNMRWVPS